MMMTSGWQGAPYVSRYGRELVSKPAIWLKESWEGLHVERLRDEPGTYYISSSSTREEHKEKHAPPIYRTVARANSTSSECVILAFCKKWSIFDACYDDRGTTAVALFVSDMFSE